MRSGCILLLFWATSSLARDFSIHEIKQFTSHFKSLVKKNELGPQASYQSYVKTAQTLKENGFSYHAKEFLWEAIQLPVNDDKTALFLELLPQISPYPKRLKKLTTMMNEYYQQHPLLKTPPIRLQLNRNRLKVSPLTSDELLSKGEAREIQSGPYGYQIGLSDINKLIKRKKYKEALKKINPELVKYGHMEVKIRYDLLNIFVKRDFDHRLNCQATYRQFNGKGSLAKRLCELLTIYLKQKKISQRKKIEFKNFIESKHPAEKHFHTMIALLD